MWWLPAAVLLAGAALALGDVPANCTYDDIVGKWTFHEGERGHGAGLDCSHARIGSGLPHALHVELLFPNVAVDQFGNEGTWTIIYNQGFEVTVNYRTYFAFSNYTLIEHHGVISHCDSTLPGWAHDVYVRDWACFVGTKTGGSVYGSGVDAGHKVHTKLIRDDLHAVRQLKSRRFKHDQRQVDRINAMQSSWRAGHNALFHGKSLWHVLGANGGFKSRVTRPQRLYADRVGRLPNYHELHRLSAVPDAFDWRNVSGADYVSPVRNQGGCGSCYAFASAGLLEARVRIQSNNTRRPVFSPQDVVQCSQYSQGCAGGFPYLIAGKYGQDYGMVLESCNPYVLPKPEESTCETKADCRRYYTTNYDYVGGYYGAGNEELMKLALVRNGPLAVGFEVYGDFPHYSGGVYHHTGVQSDRNPWRRLLRTHDARGRAHATSEGDVHKWDPFQLTNHAVVIVGYGTDRRSKEKYWSVKNSWGAQWGESGYFRIRRGTDECGIESLAVEVTPIPTY